MAITQSSNNLLGDFCTADLNWKWKKKRFVPHCENYVFLLFVDVKFEETYLTCRHNELSRSLAVAPFPPFLVISLSRTLVSLCYHLGAHSRSTTQTK